MEKLIQELYRTKFEYDFLELERKRKTIVRKILLPVYLFGIVITIVLVLPVDVGAKIALFFIGGFFTFIAAMYRFSVLDLDKELVHEFKMKIIPRLLELFSSEFQYTPRSFLSRTEYLRSGLATEKFGRFIGSDYFRIVLNGKVYCFSLIHAQQKQSRMFVIQNATIVSAFKGIFGYIAPVGSSESGYNSEIKRNIEKHCGRHFKAIYNHEKLYFEIENPTDVFAPKVLGRKLDVESFQHFYRLLYSILYSVEIAGTQHPEKQVHTEVQDKKNSPEYDDSEDFADIL